MEGIADDSRDKVGWDCERGIGGGGKLKDVTDDFRVVGEIVLVRARDTRGAGSGEGDLGRGASATTGSMTGRVSVAGSMVARGLRTTGGRSEKSGSGGPARATVRRRAHI
jgi:hypothetical protein